jgi:hypothetical protein
MLLFRNKFPSLLLLFSLETFQYQSCQKNTASLCGADADPEGSNAGTKLGAVFRSATSDN